MSQLTASIQALIGGFVDNLIATIRGASLDELIGVEGGDRVRDPQPARSKRAPETSAPISSKKAPKPGRLQRRTVEQLQVTVRAIVALVRKHKDGLRSEQIRSELELDARELPRVLQQGLSDKVLKVLGGEKRATRYGLPLPGHKASKPKAKAKKPRASSKPKSKAAPKKASSKSVSKKKPVPEAAATA